MSSRILRFSWLVAMLLVTLAAWSQTLPTAKTTPEQATAVAQTASLEQAAALPESGLTSDLSLPMIDGAIVHAVQATPDITCKQACADERTICLDNLPPATCTKNYNACIKKCG
jgi:hypothetical protein